MSPSHWACVPSVPSPPPRFENRMDPRSEPQTVPCKLYPDEHHSPPTLAKSAACSRHRGSITAVNAKGNNSTTSKSVLQKYTEQPCTVPRTHSPTDARDHPKCACTSSSHSSFREMLDVLLSRAPRWMATLTQLPGYPSSKRRSSQLDQKARNTETSDLSNLSTPPSCNDKPPVDGILGVLGSHRGPQCKRRLLLLWCSQFCKLLDGCQR